MVQDTPLATPRSFLHPSHQVSCSMSCMPTTAMPYIRPVSHNGMKKHSQHTPSKILSTKSTKSSWYAGAHWSHLLTNIARIYSPFWKAAVTVWPQPGLPGEPGPGAPQLPLSMYRASSRTREVTQAPREGQAWHGFTILSKRWCFESSTMTFLPPKLPRPYCLISSLCQETTYNLLTYTT